MKKLRSALVTFLAFLAFLAFVAFAALGCTDAAPDTAAPATLTIKVSAPTLEVMPGKAATVTVRVLGDATAPVELFVDDLPSGVAATFSAPAASLTRTSELTIIAAQDAPPTRATVRVRGRAGDASGTVDLDLAVVQASFAFELAPAAIAVPPGGTATVEIEIARSHGFEGPVEVSLLGLPNEVRAVPLTIPDGATKATLNFEVSAFAITGITTSVVVRATIGAEYREQRLALRVLGLPGEIDTSFGDGGKRLTPVVADGERVEILRYAHPPDGKLVAVGLIHRTGARPRFALVRFADDGSVDTTFAKGGTSVMPELETFGADVTVQSDGKVVAVADGADLNVMRYDAHGALDETFNATGIVATALPSGDAWSGRVAVQPDGKIVVAAVSGFRLFVARYDASGAPDATFDVGALSKAVAADGIGAVMIQPDGKIVVAVVSTSGAEFPGWSVVRSTPDGSLDTSFAKGGIATVYFGYSAEDECKTLALEPNGKLLVGGRVSVGNLQSRAAVARLLPNGALDPSFGTNGKTILDDAGGADASALAVQPDGKILLGGRARHNDFFVARLDTIGNLDDVFSTDGRVYANFAAWDNQVKSLFFVPGGRVLAAGWSGSPNKAATFARLWL